MAPEALQSRVVECYHHYLQHPGRDRLEETLAQTLYLVRMRADVKRFTKKCHRCQLGKKRKRKYSHLPPKEAETVPWRTVCVFAFWVSLCNKHSSGVSDIGRLSVPSRCDTGTGTHVRQSSSMSHIQLLFSRQLMTSSLKKFQQASVRICQHCSAKGRPCFSDPGLA